MNKPELTIIIVNYKSSSLIDDCLSSFIYDESVSLEIFVIDNDSNDPGLDLLIDKYPDVHFHQMGYNAGFSRANNWGIKHATADTVLLLNPDTLIIGNAISAMYKDFINSSFIAGGVQLQNPDGTPQISGNYFITGGINNLLPLPVQGKIIKRIGELLKVKKTNLPDSNELMPVDWINGAFIMVKKSAIEKAGLLDEDFFLYAEEIEWCSRLAKIGKLAIFGQHKVIHLQGETTNKSFDSSGKGYYNLYDKKGLQILVSNFVRIRKQYGIGWFFIHLFLYTLEIPLLFVFSLVKQILSSNGFPIKLAGGFAGNMMALYALSPKIINNSPHFYKVL